ncbi:MULTISPECIES: xanthine dehydrogenase family protein subunit M [unclassified Paraburkholderia]|uniref:FAD binding domain-containing protein n=1 Tax=unclassified Paraburkholderia TaxID=2615204 RepID=UPI0020B7DD00|nr:MULTISPECIES: FAD binding domain-containing protein [unclassified Paraburkholderia]MCP3716535.1 FAD binding domain-containing protein [Paraburkholderia sp. CNPSo 3281]MCX5539261.1 FAD binding domain-containing protein [Paraburkholderia sp. CNPSo 3076]
MKSAPFTWHRPESVARAVELLATLDNARLIAGGQTLMPMLAMRYAYVDHLIDLNAIPGLNEIALEGGEVCIGALVRQRDIEHSPLIHQYAPLMVEAYRLVGHIQTRNRGTFVGSVCNLDPASEQPALAEIFNATIVAVGPRGERRIPFHEFACGFMTTSIESDEMVTQIRLRIWNEPHGYAFEEFARRHGDFAIVGAAAMVSVDANRAIGRADVVLCGMGGKPCRLQLDDVLQGLQPSDGLAKVAASRASWIDAIGDTSASGAYRKRLACTVTERALGRAFARALNAS